MIGTIRVGNKRAESSQAFKPDVDEVIINIDRGNSVLASRYQITMTMTRRQALAFYRVDLYQDIQLKGSMFQELERIAGLLLSGQNVILMCWCAPIKCHGDLVREAVLKLVAKAVPA